jgi:hypothetical protein
MEVVCYYDNTETWNLFSELKSARKELKRRTVVLVSLRNFSLSLQVRNRPVLNLSTAPSIFLSVVLGDTEDYTADESMLHASP